MMKLMRAPNLMIGQHWINVLETVGIRCELHNRYLNGALGDIPADQCAPELWLMDERDEALARKLIDAASSGPPRRRGIVALPAMRRNAEGAIYRVLAMRHGAQSARRLIRVARAVSV